MNKTSEGETSEVLFFIGYNLKILNQTGAIMAKAKTKTVKEPSIEYEVGEQYIPVKDKNAALDDIFRDSDVKHGLTLFAAHEQNILDLWKRGEKYYLHCLIRQKKIYSKPEEIIQR